MFSAIIPPFQSPDEAQHIKRAYLLTKGNIILDLPEGGVSGGMVDTSLLAFIETYRMPYCEPSKKFHLQDINDGHHIRWSGKTVFTPTHGVSFYFPLIYTPQGIGLMVGEKLGFSVEHAYLLARFITLLCLSVILFFSFRIYRPSPLLLGLLFIPMSLFQFASASLDGIAAAISILAISVFMKITIDKEKASAWMLYVLMGSVLLVVSSRLHLLPLVLLIFASYGYTKNKAYLYGGTFVCVFMALWLLVVINYIVPYRVDPVFSISEICLYYLWHPISFFKVLYATLTNPIYLAFYWQSFWGKLGILDTPFTEQFYCCLSLMMLPIFFCSVSFETIRRQWTPFFLLSFCSISSLLLIFLLLLITWNVHPASVIEGVQGRYFLIPFLILAYAIQHNASCGNQRTRYIEMVGMGFVTVLVLFSIFNTTKLLVSRYFLTDEVSEVSKVCVSSS